MVGTESIVALLIGCIRKSQYSGGRTGAISRLASETRLPLNNGLCGVVDKKTMIRNGCNRIPHPALKPNQKDTYN